MHNEATSDIASKDAEIRALHLRLSELAQSSREIVNQWTSRVNEAERELRWAKEGRLSAERREGLARKEIEAMEADQRVRYLELVTLFTVGLQCSSQNGTMPGGMGLIAGDQSAKIRQLEQLIQTYKDELEGISRDSREVEAKLTQGAGLVKQSELDEALAKAESLSSGVSMIGVFPHFGAFITDFAFVEIGSLQETITALTAANTTLDGEVNDLMRRVASGEYNPETERCLELKTNPASKIHAVRNVQLDALKAENEALLERLKTVGNGNGVDVEASIPAESFDRLKREKEEMEQAHAKRLMRLKEVSYRVS